VNTHRRITEEHGGSTVENEYHAGVRPHCRKPFKEYTFMFIWNWRHIAAQNLSML